MKSKEKRKHKRWRWLRVTLEIAFMTAGILCSIMPYPFPLAVPIGIGVIRIISSAVAREKKAEEPQQVVYCNGAKEPKNSTSNGVSVQAPPAKGKKALVAAYAGGNGKIEKENPNAKSAGKKRGN